MADFCQQCSLEMFDRDFRELAELGPKGSVLPPEHGWTALCEGCGPTLVDQDGKCIAAYCPEHGSKAKGVKCDRADCTKPATSQPTHEKDDRALVSKVDVLEQALEFAVRGLKAAQPIVCSMCCPSVKRTSEPWTHRQSCDSLTLTLRTVEAQLSNPAAESVQHLCGARGFGQSLDDKCPGCDATSQEGQG